MFLFEFLMFDSNLAVIIFAPLIAGFDIANKFEEKREIKCAYI